MAGRDNALENEAARDAWKNSTDFAVQYSRSGSIMTTWYSGVIALCMVRGGNTAEAVKAIEKAAQYTGNFAECFEVYEWNRKPWFATAAGAYVCAVNALLQEDGRITDGIENIWTNFSFRLQGLDGAKVSAVCKDGKYNLKNE